MIFDNLRHLLKQYGVYYLSGFLFLLGIKYYYSKAGSEDLLWILSPTTRWVSILSGIPFTYEPGFGYVNHSLRYLIAPSCSGVQFMLITMAMLLFSFLHRLAPTDDLHQKRLIQTTKCLGWMLCSIIGSYLLTILVNGLRILVAIYWFPKEHTTIGIVIYFVALLIIYHLVDITASSPSVSIAKCLIPAFWYLFIVLGVPLLHNANIILDEQYQSYAVLVLSVCAGIIALYSILRFRRHFLRK